MERIFNSAKQGGPYGVSGLNKNQIEEGKYGWGLYDHKNIRVVSDTLTFMQSTG